LTYSAENFLTRRFSRSEDSESEVVTIFFLILIIRLGVYAYAEYIIHKRRKMNNSLKLIAFDGDDTLWEDISFYQEAVKNITEILGKYADTTSIPEDLYKTEVENISVLGYGAKSFTISMIETAIRLSSQKIHPGDIQEIIAIGKSVVSHPIRLLPDVREVLTCLSSHYRLMLVTKGDFYEQKAKISHSGLSDYFAYIEIVSEKDEHAYSEILERYSIAPENFMMIGNSLRSDVVPVLNIAGNAVHIPHKFTWYHEQVSGDIQKEYSELKGIRELPGLINSKIIYTV
ncbi:HAD family hydrolase, partial [Desulfococcaceae bacterium HSG8]|nr:HAD family hydrolase [Desulfococcaceae bacterium HSG8]